MILEFRMLNLDIIKRKIRLLNKHQNGSAIRNAEGSKTLGSEKITVIPNIMG